MQDSLIFDLEGFWPQRKMRVTDLFTIKVGSDEPQRVGEPTSDFQEQYRMLDEVWERETLYIASSVDGNGM